MLDVVYIQSTPMPNDLQPLNAMEVIAYAADDREDPFKVFIDSEKSAFDVWTDFLPIGYFDLVSGYPTRFVVLVSKLPDEEDHPLFLKAKGMLGEISTGAVYGDVGTSIDGVSMGSRARWTVTVGDPGPNKVEIVAKRIRATEILLVTAAVLFLLFFIFVR